MSGDVRNPLCDLGGLFLCWISCSWKGSASLCWTACACGARHVVPPVLEQCCIASAMVARVTLQR